ncbi:MAG: NAD-dependent epimerase/dehydratase family protein [Fuerstiella sp.]
MPNSERSLIVGCGYLGSQVAAAWADQGRMTSAVTRLAERAAEFRAAGLLPVQLDLARPDDGDPVPDADVVLWSVGFDRTAGVPRERVWLDGLAWLINHLPTAPKRFIYTSSTSVYGGNHDGASVTEETKVDPETDGGQCCVKAEQLARTEFARRFPETQVIVLRLAGIYGPDRLLRRVSDLQTRTPLPGHPDHWLNLIHVDDAVRMVDRVSTQDGVPDVVNVVNSQTLTRRQYYTRLAELVGAPPPVFTDAAASTTGRARGGNRRVVSIYRDTLNVSFRFDDVREGLADAVRRTGL